MSLISFTPLQDGVTGVNAAATNTPLSTIYNDYNGNITDANIASNAAIAGSKIALSSGVIPSAFRVYRNSAFNATNTLTTIVMDTKVFDTGTNVSISTGLFTAAVPGKYIFGGRSGTAAASGNEILTALIKAGSAAEIVDGNRGISTNTQSGLIASTVTALFQLSAGDTVGLQIFSNSTVGAQAGAETTYFWGHFVSA